MVCFYKKYILDFLRFFEIINFLADTKSHKHANFCKHRHSLASEPEYWFCLFLLGFIPLALWLYPDRISNLIFQTSYRKIRQRICLEQPSDNLLWFCLSTVCSVRFCNGSFTTPENNILDLLAILSKQLCDSTTGKKIKKFILLLWFVFVSWRNGPHAAAQMLNK